MEHYKACTGLNKNAALKMQHWPFEVTATYNKLTSNSILLGRPLGYVSNNAEWKRSECFWCRRALVNSSHYLWDCSSETVSKAREVFLLPQSETEVARFDSLPGADTAAKLNKYKQGILRYEPEKCGNFISAMLHAEQERREMLRKLEEENVIPDCVEAEDAI